MRRVSSVKYLHEHSLQIVFNNGETRVVNFDELVDKGGFYFGPLKDVKLFKKVTLDEFHYTICWPNGADLSPDILYEMGVEVKKGVKKPSTTRAKLSRSIGLKSNAGASVKSKHN